MFASEFFFVSPGTVKQTAQFRAAVTLPIGPSAELSDQYFLSEVMLFKFVVLRLLPIGSYTLGLGRKEHL